MDAPTQVNPGAEQFLNCLANAQHVSSPYDYWLLKDPLSDAACDAMANLPIAPPPSATFDGRREANNATRMYFTPELQARYAVCRDVADIFRNAEVKAQIAAATGARIADAKLRIEYCLDTDGFWLEPHVDIPVKRFTMLIYLSHDPELRDAGTDVYDATQDHKLVARAPYEFNAGMIFIPGTDTWHGFAKRRIRGVRKSLIVNYVSDDWRAVAELA
jgi:hypothetical protein